MHGILVKIHKSDPEHVNTGLWLVAILQYWLTTSSKQTILTQSVTNRGKRTHRNPIFCAVICFTLKLLLENALVI